jgi:hypothetical protein
MKRHSVYVELPGQIMDGPLPPSAAPAAAAALAEPLDQSDSPLRKPSTNHVESFTRKLSVIQDYRYEGTRYLYGDSNSPSRYVDDRWRFIVRTIDYLANPEMYPSNTPTGYNYQWPREFETPEGQKWAYLGNGNSNIVYRSVNADGSPGYKVYKIAFSACSDIAEAAQTPERCVRIWNLFNPDYEARVYGEGWIATYIDGVEPSTKEITDCLVDGYQKYGRILVDAFSLKRNIFSKFKKVESIDDNGNQITRIVCVNVDFGIRLIRDLDESQTSLDFWKSSEKQYSHTFSKYHHALSTEKYGLDVRIIIRMIEALLAIEKFFPDCDVERLKNDYNMVNQFADLYYYNLERVFSNRPANEFNTYELSEKALAEKDSRGAALYDWGLRGVLLRKIYRDRKNYPLRVLEQLINDSRRRNINPEDAIEDYEYAIKDNAANEENARKQIFVEEGNEMKNLVDQFFSTKTSEKHLSQPTQERYSGCCGCW